MIQIYSRFLKPYAGKTIAVILMTVFTTFCSLLLPMISKQIINNGAINGDTDLIIQSMVVMLSVAVVSILVSLLANYISSGVSMGFAKNVRSAFFSHVSELSQGDINKIGASSLFSRQTNDIQQLQTMLIQMMQMFLVAPIMVVGGIVMAVVTAPTMMWMLVVVLPCAILIMVMILLRVAPIFRKTQQKLDTVNRVIRENLNGMRVVRAFNREEYEREHFEEVNSDYRRLAERGNKLMNCANPLMTVLINAINLLIIWFGSRYMDAGNVSYGDIQAFVQYVSMILNAFMLCAMLLIILPRVQTSAARLNEVLDLEPSITDPLEPLKIPEGTESSIMFRNVSFSYPGADVPVLSSLNFSAKKGQTLAIIGGTGSGKSTILNLITRDYDVTDGEVLLDGVDVRKLAQEDLRGRLAVVPQKAFLFSGSIFENVRYGKEDASPEEVEYALSVAQAKEFVDQKDYGMYSYISQGGTNVSGGQRQRLAIARALVRHPDVYLFDDSFSALDFKTDAKLRKMLKKEVKDAVTIIVAQRVSTIQDADRIIVLDAGRIIGDGTHEELMESCAVYREIALSQVSESEVKGA